MRDKKIIILLLVIGAFIIIFLFALIFLHPKRNTPQKPSNSSATQQRSPEEIFAEDFVKKFVTYSYQDTSNYIPQLTPYIAPKYLANFQKRFRLPKNITPDIRNNYSKYQSTIQVLTLAKSDSRQTIYVEYVASKVDAPNRPQEFKDTNAVTVVLDKINGKFLITAVDFSTPQ